jgi:hypothetical protein
MLRSYLREFTIEVVNGRIDWRERSYELWSSRNQSRSLLLLPSHFGGFDSVQSVLGWYLN